MFEYWEAAAKDQEVDKKYICDIESDLFAKVLHNKFKILEIKSGHIHPLWTWIICEKI